MDGIFLSSQSWYSIKSFGARIYDPKKPNDADFVDSSPLASLQNISNPSEIGKKPCKLLIIEIQNMFFNFPSDLL